MLRLKQRWFKTAAGKRFRWQITGTCPYTGERVRESTGTDSKDEAQGILTAYLARAHDEAVHGTAGSALFAEAVVEYLGKGGEARFVDPLLTAFGKRKLRDIRDADLTDYCAKTHPECKPATLVRQVYGPMQAVWNAAVRARMATPRLFSRPKVKRLPIKYPPDAWLFKLLKQLTTLEQRTVVLFMSFSGVRVSEAARVLVKHYDPEQGRVLIETTKNEEPREILLPPFVNEAMRLLPRRQPNDRLFGYSSRFPIATAIKRACLRGGLEHFSPHRLGRHAFAARFMRDGHSIKALMEAGGWRTLGAVSVYSHLERSRVQEAVANVSTPLGTLLTQEPSLLEKKP